jgi:hypothetical protein
MDGEYNRLVPDYEEYRSRKIVGREAPAPAANLPPTPAE